MKKTQKIQIDKNYPPILAWVYQGDKVETKLKKISWAFFSILLLIFSSNAFCGTPGTIKWSQKYESANIPSVAIGKDGTVYATGGTRLKAINPANGVIIWNFAPGTTFPSSPVILIDGSICVGGSNGTLYVVNKNGTLRWSKGFGSSINYEVATNTDGTIFLAHGNKLYCISMDGEIIWTYTATDNFNSPPVIGIDGSLYLSAAVPRTLYAINPDGTLKWKKQFPWAAGNDYDDPALLGIPAVDLNGLIFVGDSRGYLRGIAPETGTLKYEYGGMDRASMTYQPITTTNGYVFIGCSNTLIYKFPGGITFLPQGAVMSTPAIGADGKLYFGVAYQVNYHQYYFYAVSSSNMGEVWKCYIGHQMLSSPAIGKDGIAYVGTQDGYIYAIYIENTEYQKNSPYPKYRHDNYNSGNSMYNTYIKCQPAVYNYGNVNLGAKSYKTFALTNISNTSYTVGNISISGENHLEGEFFITDDCSGESILAGQTLYFTVCFRPLLNGKRSAAVRIPFGDKVTVIGLFGNGGGDGQSALVAIVYDGSNGNLVEEAEVKVAGQTGMTDAEGKCVFSPLDAGGYEIEVNKDGYSPQTKSVEILASSNVYKNIVIYPSDFTEPKITDVSSKYEGTVFYIDGVNFNVEFTVNIDWAGHTPGRVKFITPKQTIEEPTNASVVKRTFNMGADFGVGGTLKVQAITESGAISEEKEANFVVIKPLPFFPLAVLDMGSYFSYESKFGINWNLFNEGVNGSSIPSDIPLFGGNPVWLKFIPTVSAEVTSDGAAEIGLEFEGMQKEQKIESGNLAGFSFSLYPMVDIEGQYYPSFSDWDWGGYAGIHGKAEFKKSWPFVVMAGPVPVPMYAKASFSLEAEALLGVTSIDPLGLNGKISIEPYVRGSLGAGVDEMLAVEGWIGGGLTMGLQFPEEPTLEELSIFLNGGFTIYAFLFTWENELLHWEWSLIEKKLVSSKVPVLDIDHPSVAPRDYLQKNNYGMFAGGKILTKSSDARTQYYTLQENVFPHSEPAISSSGQYLYAVWLYDDPQRSSLNRTKLVFSSFDGTTWSEPVAVSDDGTADFHPDIIVFDDGYAAVVWENAKTQLPDDTTFEQMTQNLEICVSFYNPETKTWTPQYSLTDNNYLDRSPKIKGPDKNTLMVIWVSNPDNHITGNTQNPNVIYSTVWDGTNWAVPVTVVDASNYPDFKKPLLGYDFGFRKVRDDWTAGLVYFCFDMDEDLSTINDREIFANEWDSLNLKGWRANPWNRTNDNLPDGNVRVFTIGNQFEIYFLKGNHICKTSYFLSDNAYEPVVFYTFEGDYSSNISDYKIARHPDGRVAIVWTEPEQFSSDLFAVFYDPVAKLCGKPQRLTDDSETEHSPVVAFYDHDTLISIYDRVYLDVFEEKMCLSSGKNVRLPIVKSTSTDLAFFIHTITEDVSFETGSFVITPLNPQIGSTAEIYITIENTGNTVLSNIPVYFYAGDPDNGGTLIGNTIITSNLVPGETTIVSVEWEVPAVSQPVTIYAVIDPEDTLSGEISSNNTTSIDCIFPDIGSANLTGCFITEDLLFVTGTLQNIGSLPSGQFVVEVHRDSPDGELIYQDNINQLLPNEIRQINFLFNVTDPKNLYLYLIADPQNAVREYDETNNMYVYKLNPSLLMGDINDDGEVDISDVILCLRMAIGLPVVINSQQYNPPYSDRLKKLADMNSEQTIDISDVILILRKAIGLD